LIFKRQWKYEPSATTSYTLTTGLAPVMNKKSTWTTSYPSSKPEKKSSVWIHPSTGLNAPSRTEKTSELSRMQVLPTTSASAIIYTSTPRQVTQTEKFAFTAEEQDITHPTISDINIKENPLNMEKCASTLTLPDTDVSTTSLKPEQSIPFRDS
jgi:hypothetical protein